MKHSIKVGLSFGLTSAVITTLGLMVGLNASTHSQIVVLGGILTIAIADAFSDAMGIHVSEESENKHSSEEIWQSTISTFLAKFIFALTFIIPVLLLELSQAIIAGIIWGMVLLAAISYKFAREHKTSPWKTIAEHLVIALVVIGISNFAGSWIATVFA